MKVNKIPTAKEKTFSLEGFRGIDMVSSETSGAKYRPVKSVNMYLSGGIVHKRHGWREIKKFSDTDGLALRINGIHKYTKDDESYFIVHAKDSFFKCSKNFSSLRKIPFESGAAKDTKTTSYHKDVKLFIIGCGGILVFDGEKIFDMEKSDFCYIPTTSYGRYDHRIGKEAKTGEAPNLLTKRRKNTMVGIPYTYDLVVGGNTTTISSYPSFTLDAPCDKNSEKGISIEISIYTGSENPYTAYLDNGNQYDGRVILKFLISKSDLPEAEYINVTKNVQSVLSVGGQNLRLSNGADTIAPRVTFSGRLNLFSFNFDMNCGEDNNIVFEFDADSDLYSDTIKNCSFGAVFETSNNISHLILSGNKMRANECYFSENSANGAYAYFPSDNIINSGDERYKVCAFLPLSNDEIAILKENSFSRCVFSVSGAKTLFREYTSPIQCSCANEYACGNMNFDSLFFEKNGVFAIDKSSQNTGKVLARSGNLSFEAFDLNEIKNAFCLESDNCLYLFIGNIIFMCDARYKFYRDNRLDSSFEYEWWVWENCPARCAVSVDGKIYMGKENGTIAIFDEGYSDKEIINISEADMLYDYEKQKLTLNSAININDGDKVYLGHHLALLATNINYNPKSGEIFFADSDFFYTEDGQNVLKIADGSKIRIKSNGILDKKSYIISSIDATCRCAKIISSGILPVTIDEIYLEIENGECEYTIEKIDDGYEFYRFGKKVKLYDTNEAFTITYSKSKSVFCEFVTPFLNLDVPNKSKSLVNICITPSLTSGKINFGYKTKNTSYTSKMQHFPALNFENLNFKTFSLRGDCARSFVLRVREPSFNYISFFFGSDTDEDCSVEGLYTTFRINDNTTKGMI